jgi:hypothetical protein
MKSDGTAPDADLQPATGQNIDDGGFLSDSQGVVEGQQDYGGAKTDLAGSLRCRNCDVERRRHARKRTKEMQLSQPRDIKTELVSQYELLDGFVIPSWLRLVGSTWELIE